MQNAAFGRKGTKRPSVFHEFLTSSDGVLFCKLWVIHLLLLFFFQLLAKSYKIGILLAHPSNKP